jgi:alkanesulfonate monooxygenase SsuD/methylene tetrahydromethanopterin reductase-like flavin-dependent oxidoreductase (luciferase family)
LLSYSGRFDQLDRGAINPRPDRIIPIWIGGAASTRLSGPHGKAKPAIRRAAQLGDGFIFAGPPDLHMAAWQALQDELARVGRSVAGFGADLITSSARSVDETLEFVERWEAAGGTHVSIACTGMGFDTVDAHIRFIEQVRGRIS